MSKVTPEDLYSESFNADPFPPWERLRHEQPLFRDTVAECWLLTRYDDVAAVLQDHETYSTRPYERMFTQVIGPTMVQMDGEDHDVRRKIIAPALMGRQLDENYVPLIEEVVGGLFDGLPREGSVDLVANVTWPLPVKVIATILGLEEELHPYLGDLASVVVEALAGEEPALSKGVAAHTEFSQRIDELITEREAVREKDLISAIAHGRTEDGERLSRQEIASFISLLLVAGGETTDRAIANFWWVLLQHPPVWESLRDDPSRLDAAFTEFMRRDGVVVYEDREVTTDVEWHGQLIREGEIVRVGLMSANNDETVFEDPRLFDLARSDLNLEGERRAGGRTGGRAHHLGFGLGKHFCIGYRLARAEVVIATRELLDRMPRVRVPEDTAPSLRVDWFHRHLDRLVVERA
ncbi:MAG: cytochrome P450 [Acidimicrobiales bacterium]